MHIPRRWRLLGLLIGPVMLTLGLASAMNYYSHQVAITGYQTASAQHVATIRAAFEANAVSSETLKLIQTIALEINARRDGLRQAEDWPAFRRIQEARLALQNKRLQELLAPTDVLLISDEVYEHMVFDGQSHQSALRFPGLAARAFVISSFGKTYHVTGWKVAYCLAPRELMAEFRKAHQFIVFTVHAPSQYALADFMKKPGWYDQLKALYQGKRDIFRQALAGSRFELLPCQGTYFQCVKYAAISDEGDRAFVERLTRDHGVAAIPVSAFYPDGEDHGVIRFCFAKSAATLEQALERLIKL